jgi:hypothetical protein
VSFHAYVHRLSFVNGMNRAVRLNWTFRPKLALRA